MIDDPFTMSFWNLVIVIVKIHSDCLNFFILTLDFLGGLWLSLLCGYRCLDRDVMRASFCSGT